MEKKTYTAPFELKEDGQPGEFRAVFATLNVTDHDRDVTVPGAFEEQAVVVEPWNHGWTLPVGKGMIKANEYEAWIEGQFFLDTEVGKENYQTVKNLGPLAEWSYTFYILESAEADPAQMNGADRILEKMDVIGVSPVTRGAGLNTRTTSIKAQKRAIAPHSTPTTEVAWDGPANEARLKTEETAAYYRKAYAWQDLDADPETKAAYRFIHHMVDQAGDVGAANIRACQTGIGVLNGARGGTTIPEADRQGVYNHLAKHLRDADIEPPELKALEVGGDSTPTSPPYKGGSNEADEGEAQAGKPSEADILTKINLMEIRMIVAGSEE